MLFEEVLDLLLVRHAVLAVWLHVGLDPRPDNVDHSGLHPRIGLQATALISQNSDLVLNEVHQRPGFAGAEICSMLFASFEKYNGRIRAHANLLCELGVRLRIHTGNQEVCLAIVDGR